MLQRRPFCSRENFKFPVLLKTFSKALPLAGKPLALGFYICIIGCLGYRRLGIIPKPLIVLIYKLDIYLLCTPILCSDEAVASGGRER